MLRSNITTLKEIRENINRQFTYNQYRCPLTNNFFYDPVIASDSKTYEREAIEDYMFVNKKSPITGQLFMDTNLYPNDIMRELITHLFTANPQLKKMQYKSNEIKTLIKMLNKADYTKFDKLERVSVKIFMNRHHNKMKSFLENCTDLNNFKTFIDRCDNLEQEDKFGRRMLYYVIRFCKNPDFSFYLIEKKKVTFEFSDIDGWRPIHQAALTGSYLLIRFLLDLNVEVKHKIKKYGKYNGDHSVVRFLLKNTLLSNNQKEELIRLTIQKEVV
jgi:ankyrin repeat protein